MYSTTWIAAAVRSVLYASALSAGVLLCASSAHADDRDQLKSIQADIAARQRAIKQQQQQRASLLAQLKAQEEAIAAAARKLRETQDSLNQLNKQIDEMNAALAKLERQRASQERNLAAQLDAAFRQGPHTGIQMVLSGEEGQRNQRMQVYFSYFNQARQETIAELKKTREEMAVQKSMLEEKQSQQQTLVYEQKAQQAKREQARNERKKTLSGLESSIQQGQQQLSELRANESRLRGRIAQAEAAAKARADREARDAQAVRDRQQEASRKGTTYKPTESERSLMSRTGGLGSPRGQAFWPVRGPLLHRYGEQLQGELRWKGMVIAASEGTEVRAIADGRVILADNRNGQAITLSSELQEKGVTDLGGLKRLIDRSAPGSYTFAHTFPTGTHAMWLYYWLASAGIDPFNDVRNVVVPPPQMVMNMRIGNMSGFCVGEPWNARAINDRIGFTAATSQDIWPEHPEKVLGTRRDWVERNPNTARALVAALMEAQRWIAASPENTRETARLLARRGWLNTKEQYLTGRMLGEYDNGLGRRWQDAHPMRFWAGGEVSFPWLSDGMWFLTQFRRWGLLKQAPDYLAVASRINRIDVWQAAAQAVGGISAPAARMRSSTLMDGTVWNGSDPEGYARHFSIQRKGA